MGQSIGILVQNHIRVWSMYMMYLGRYDDALPSGSLASVESTAPFISVPSGTIFILELLMDMEYVHSSQMEFSCQEALRQSQSTVLSWKRILRSGKMYFSESPATRPPLRANKLS